MTNNKVYLSETGIETVKVNRSDGLAIAEFKRRAIQQLIISSEKNEVVACRARKLGIHCIRGTMDKKASFEKYCLESKVSHANTIFVGNEINDIEVMQTTCWSICPADAHPKVKEISTIVLNANGGNGVVKEILDLYLYNCEDN